jgi:lipopolysaccharide transport system permease protein
MNSSSVIIKSKTPWWKLNLGDIWHYRDLIMLFVRRDFVAVYKQTILGPLWFFIQPLLTTLVMTFVFSRVAKIPTDGIPAPLFYLAGTVAWNYFADCLQGSATTLTMNAKIFGKVYFPRLTVPVALVISKFIKFAIQFLIFLAMLVYYSYQGFTITVGYSLLLFPLLLLIMAGLGLGIGVMVSALSAKYRDLQYLVVFGTQLMMFLTPVIYPMSVLERSYSKWIILANPMSSVIESFKYIFFGQGTFSFYQLGYSFGLMIILLLSSLFIFKRIERSFVDIV